MRIYTYEMCVMYGRACVMYVYLAYIWIRAYVSYLHTCWSEYRMTVVVCMPTYTYVVHVHVYTFLWMWACMSMCAYICVCVRMYVCMYVCVCVCMYFCMYCVCMYVSIYVCTTYCVCISSHFHDWTDANLLVFLAMFMQFSVCRLIP
jgi:hypothetical protein